MKRSLDVLQYQYEDPLIYYVANLARGQPSRILKARISENIPCMIVLNIHLRRSHPSNKES